MCMLFDYTFLHFILFYLFDGTSTKIPSSRCVSRRAITVNQTENSYANASQEPALYKLQTTSIPEWEDKKM